MIPFPSLFHLHHYIRNLPIKYFYAGQFVFCSEKEKKKGNKSTPKKPQKPRPTYLTNAREATSSE